MNFRRIYYSSNRPLVMKSSTTTSPDPSTRKTPVNWERICSKIELETCIANHEKPVYGFPHMSFEHFEEDDMEGMFESRPGQKMNKHRKLAKKNELLPRPADISIEGCKMKGASNKHWKILSKHILSKHYEAEKPPEEIPSSPISPFKNYYSPRDSPKSKKARKQGAAF